MATLVSMTSCTAMERRNTAIGGGLGAAAGALIAGPERAVAGAIIGGAAGSAIGYGVTQGK